MKAPNTVDQRYSNKGCKSTIISSLVTITTKTKDQSMIYVVKYWQVGSYFVAKEHLRFSTFSFNCHFKIKVQVLLRFHDSYITLVAAQMIYQYLRVYTRTVKFINQFICQDYYLIERVYPQADCLYFPFY